jgi:hypothetical protein
MDLPSEQLCSVNFFFLTFVYPGAKNINCIFTRDHCLGFADNNIQHEVLALVFSTLFINNIYQQKIGAC